MSGICGAATRRTAGALDPTEGTKAIDRVALEEALDICRDALGNRFGDAGRMILAAARAHRDTLPKTKMVEVWRVEWAVLAINRWVAHHRGEPTREEANHCLARLIEADTYGNTLRCARVTGPHFQEVPA